MQVREIFDDRGIGSRAAIRVDSGNPASARVIENVVFTMLHQVASGSKRPMAASAYETA